MTHLKALKIFSRNLISSFWNSVDIKGANECWPWKEAKPKEYGYYKCGIMAYQMAWMIGNGKPLQKGFLITHECDNPPCCNPRHLTMGTHEKNAKDMMIRGRQKTPFFKGHSIRPKYTRYRGLC